MATFYWLGSRNSNVMSNFNWSSIDPETLIGITGTTGTIPYAPRTPSTGDVAVFGKYVITGVTGITYTYPIFAPTGTMGVSGGGATCAYLNSINILGNYEKGIGTGVGFTMGTFLNCYASSIGVNKNVTNGSTFAYNINLAATGLGITNAARAAAMTVVAGSTTAYSSGANSLPSALKLYVKGVGNITTVDNGTYTSGNINIDDFTGRVGPFKNQRGFENITVGNGVVVEDDTFGRGGLIQVNGFGNILNVEKGFGSGSTAAIEMIGFSTKQGFAGNQAATQELYFMPESWAGISGGITGSTQARTKVILITLGAQYFDKPTDYKQQVSVYHPVDFTYLQFDSGNMKFAYVGSSTQARIFEGTIGTEACIFADRYGCFTTYPPNDFNNNPTFPRGYGVSVVSNSFGVAAPYMRRFPIVLGTLTPPALTVVASDDNSFWTKLFQNSAAVAELIEEFSGA
jgi:hypothetical protein